MRSNSCVEPNNRSVACRPGCAGGGTKKGTYRVPFPGFTATAPGWFGGYFCIFPS